MTEHATPQEITDAFACLTERDKRVLHAVARSQLGGTRFSEPLDLIYEALFLAVEGRRNWPRAIEFTVFMLMTVRSVAYADRTVSENAKTVSASSDDVAEWADGAARHPSAEECAERNQNVQRGWEDVRYARNALERRDPQAARVLDKIIAEEPAAEIRRELGLCVAELDAAKKRVLRALRNSARL